MNTPTAAATPLTDVIAPNGSHASGHAPTGLHISQQLVEQQITATEFFRTQAGMTICAATMQNGYIAVGHSAPSGSETAASEADEVEALTDAQHQARSVLGYHLCETMWTLEHPQDATVLQQQLSQIVGGHLHNAAKELQSSKAQPEAGDTKVASRVSATTQPALDHTR